MRRWTRCFGTARDIQVYNALSGKKESLVLPPDRPLKWYMCGPTVYDHAHLGHARTYVCFDIIHRILTDYFSIPVHLAMGMTDVDDKIIKRANETQQSWAALASLHERSFITDMGHLNVRQPSAYLRVSEHIEEIIAFITKIIANKLAYEVKNELNQQGGIYFDVSAFAQQGYKYGKLHPSCTHDEVVDLPASSEEAAPSAKRNVADFALWKAAKVNEPAWDSPWGRGRPGWHIECSAIATTMFGASFDMHSGGIDLKFPHHNNEIAQSEAHFSCPNEPWVRVWIHSGHLHIAGQKMSKSLKNFISIQEYLATTQNLGGAWFRMFCASSPYHTPLNFTLAQIHESRTKLEKFVQFFLTVSSALKAESCSTKKWGVLEHQLAQEWQAAEIRVNACLSDDFNTSGALQCLHRLVSHTHSYLAASKAKPSLSATANAQLLSSVAGFVSRILHVIGFSSADLGLTPPVDTAASAQAAEGLLLQAGDILGGIRNKIRAVALKNKDKELLVACDELRDKVFPLLGANLVDMGGGKWELRRTRPQLDTLASLAANASPVPKSPSN